MALRHEFDQSLIHVPLSRCAARCSERGACLQRRGGGGEPFCRCDSYYSGQTCEFHSSPYCWNDCAGRGTCIDGFCRCEPPYYGPGCSLSASSPLAPAAARPGFASRAAASRAAASPSRAAASRLAASPPVRDDLGGGGAASRTRFTIHVYDLPPLVLRRRTYGSDPDPIFNTYHTFLSRLLADRASLAPAPDTADLLLAPAFGTNMEKLLEYYEHAQEHLASVFRAAWSRHRGDDHIWLITGDGGGCDLRGRHAPAPLRTSGVLLAHYLKLNSSGTGKGGGGCGLRFRDVALPPEVPRVETETYLARGTTPPASRRLTFFFSGNVPDAHLVDATSDESLAREGYSEGVRQLVWKYHRHRSPAYKIVPRSPTYETDWAASKYCLAPLGVGWGVRLTWALTSGCVPVLGSTEVGAWFDDALAYDSFAVRGVPTLAFKGLHRILEAIPPSRLETLHRNVLRHRPLFLWGRGGMAYNLTMHELCWRARFRRAGVDCTALLPAAAAALVIPPAARPRTAASERGWWRRASNRAPEPQRLAAPPRPRARTDSE